jgi:hypothetical protein
LVIERKDLRDEGETLKDLTKFKGKTVGFDVPYLMHIGI